MLARLLERGDRPVYAPIRASNQRKADARLRETIAKLLGEADDRSERATAVPADLCSPGMGMDESRREWLADRVSLIIHCAASVSFELPLDESRAINVDGTRRLLDFAELCQERGRLECFTHISTAYVAGTHSGRYSERDLYVGQDFRNSYELSKFEAESMVRDRSLSLPVQDDSLPVQVLRPSIIVGDSRTGWTPAFNVLYTPLKAFARGSYPALPARLDSPVDVVPVDFVADAIVALAGKPGTTHHLVAADHASSVGEVADFASSYLEKSTPPVVPPRIYRRALHPLLVRIGDERRKRALRRTEQFFPYLEIEARYENDQTRKALSPQGIDVPPLSSYFDRLMDFAIAADWGREPIPRNLAGTWRKQAPKAKRRFARTSTGSRSTSPRTSRAVRSA